MAIRHMWRVANGLDNAAIDHLKGLGEMSKSINFPLIFLNQESFAVLLEMFVCEISFNGPYTGGNL